MSLPTNNKRKTKDVRRQARKRACQSTSFKSQREDIQKKINCKIANLKKEAIHNDTYQCARMNNADEPASENPLFSCGRLVFQCEHNCGALHFENETTTHFCCVGGKGSHETMQSIPAFLEALLRNRHFRTHIRAYNCTFQIATMGSTLRKTDPNSFYAADNFPFHIRVHGMIYHSIPPVLPREGVQPRFAQLYIIDNALDQIIVNSKANNYDLDQAVANTILQFLKRNNPWAIAISRNVRKFMVEQNFHNVRLDIQNGTGQFTAPSADDIAGFIPDDSMEFDRHRSILLHSGVDNKFSCISEMNPNYDPTHYVLMFPHGDPGWSLDWKNSRFCPKKTDGTLLKFYRQRMQIRKSSNTLALFGRLFHEYVVDQWSKIEKSRLDYIRTHQKDLRASTSEENRPEDVPVQPDEGFQYTYLPQSYEGSPRYYRNQYLNAMNSVNLICPGTYFITMTANPNWPEILESLQEQEQWTERPDIIARVFKLKFDELLHDLTKRHVMGLCLGFLAVTEFQKRGMPHGHIILQIHPDDAPHTGKALDQYISAQLPDQSANPVFYEMVTKFMLHGPCSKSYCQRKDGTCRFHYPQPFLNETMWENNQTSILYRRPNNGRQFVNRKKMIFTNADVVPYNPWLLMKYRCHINVVACMTKISSIRYLFRYTTKGQDMATIKMTRIAGGQHNNQIDEISEYINGRYITAPEAIWRIFGFGLCRISPSTIRLPVHLPGKKFHVIGRVGEQRYSTKSDTPNNEAEVPSNESQLEAFFSLNHRRIQGGDADFPLLYAHISKFFVWDVTHHCWSPRKQVASSPTGEVLNRIDTVSIASGETFYLRHLLLSVPNPTSFDDLKTFNNIRYNTFQEASYARGLLRDDNISINTMDEAVRIHPPKYARHVFAQLLAYGDVETPLELLSMFIYNMADDYIQQNSEDQHCLDTNGLSPKTEILVMQDIDDHLKTMSRSLDYYAPLQQRLEKIKYAETRSSLPPTTYTTEQRTDFMQQYNDCFLKCNTEQKEAMETFKQAFDASNSAAASTTHVEDGHNHCFLLLAAAGTGKTFVQNGFIQYIKSVTGDSKSFVAVSTTAISAQLLEAGRTAHSRFKLPIRVKPHQTKCSIQFNSKDAEELRIARVLIWDEIFGARKELIDAVDKFFRELNCVDKPFGNLLTIFSGDLRQTLPKTKGNRATTVSLCFPRAKCYRFFKVIHLLQNMRLFRNAENESFAQFLLDLGDGKIDSPIYLPQYIKTVTTMQDLINDVYDGPGIINLLSPEDLATRAILSPLNRTVAEINSTILSQKLNAIQRTYYSIDSEMDNAGNIIDDLPPEILHKANRPGMPLHELKLKEGAIVMCLRNMSREVCNGTKLQVLKFHNHLLDCKILVGPGIGKMIALPRIKLRDTSNPELFLLQRQQFPIALAYAMTIDKSQGQSLTRVGLDLQTQCFAHGQLYTAMSRPRNVNYLTVLTETGDHQNPRNVVWPEVFP
eukprot:scaffold319_cov97-Cylindrotheca_fusiformis.AAC.14